MHPTNPYLEEMKQLYCHENNIAMEEIVIEEL
jgi:hypothetical protein